MLLLQQLVEQQQQQNFGPGWGGGMRVVGTSPASACPVSALPCPASSEYSEYSGATLAKPSAAQCRVNHEPRKSSPCWHSGYSLYAGTVGQPRAHSPLLLNQT